MLDLLTLSRNHHEKTIEGDLFSAFVAAGAISKANGDDPKKSSLTRCARTDKGVHAAGNLISAKLIIDDPDIVRKINENLTPQIRVFSIQRTNGSFSAYQFCDSRIYEYLIPTHAFLPPHPSSFLGKKLVELAEEADDLERYQSRQREVSTFWEETEERYVKPVLEQLDPSIRSIVFNALYELEANHFHVDKSDSLDRTGSENPIFQHSKIDSGVGLATDGPIQQPSTSKVEDSDQQSIRAEIVDPAQHSANLKENVIQDQGDTSDQIEDPAQDSTSLKEVDVIQTYQRDTSDQLADPAQHSAGIKEDATQNQRDISDQLEDPAQHSANLTEDATQEKKATIDQLEDPSPKTTDPSPLDVAIKKLRAEYMAAKKAYRIHPDRLARVRSALSLFLGSQNYHNYTVHKDFRDPSAKRVIKSFVVHDQPVLINGTEWLSLKVHGQSFMMHQIRKMVSMVALVVRCGCHEGRLQDSFMKENMSIPKAPGLGLLLERPVFDTYNERLLGQYGREKIDFGKFQVVMEEFKQREIYERIFREEERDNQFVPLPAPILSFRLLPNCHLPSLHSQEANFRNSAPPNQDSTPSSPPSTTLNPRNSSTFLP